eukprot:7535893-Pyramimonas_sp.AAC.1
MMDQSDAGSAAAGIFSRWTNQMQEARVYSHDGPITGSCAPMIVAQHQSVIDEATTSLLVPNR